MNFELGIPISPNRQVTDEGYLYCENCPVARVGSRVYNHDEMPEVQPKDGKVTVIRGESALFNEDTIRSFENKPVSLNHPPGVEMFDASNWKDFFVGVMRNVRKGEGENGGCLVADLFIYDRDAIKAITSGEMTELSLGYKSVVKDQGNGVGLEGPLMGNHVAVVPKGRCGSLCAIKDGANFEGEEAMSQEILDAIKGLSEQVNGLSERVAKLEGTKDEDPDPQDKPQDNPPAEQKPTPTDDKKDVEPGMDEEAVKELVKRVLAEREAQEVADAAVIKDAATVAPSVDKATPDLAMAALTEFAKTEFGKTFINELGGLASVKKDAAAGVLKTCAAAVRVKAVSETATGKKDAKAQESAPSFFEQAAKMWQK